MDPIDRERTRARELIDRGDEAGARTALLAALVHAPDDLRVLTDLGTLLFRSGYRRAAQTVYARAVQAHPRDAIANANLANASFDAGDLAAARQLYETAISIQPDFAAAHQGLSFVYNRLGDEAAACIHRELGFRDRAVVVRPYRGTGIGLHVLVLVAAGGGNIFTDHLLDDRRFGTTTLAVDFLDPNLTLPPHDVVFNTIGDADRAAGALHAASAIVERSRARIINHPTRVLATSRVQNAGRFSHVPGVVTPRTIVVQRAALRSAADTFGFPLLLRSLGFHTGQFFVKVDRMADLDVRAGELPGEALLMMDFLDARSPDGNVRKYRVMCIGGKLYPLHAAISSHWKVHYFTADMTDRSDHRAEDARFIAHMSSVLGTEALATLASVSTVLGLDYGGIDFGRMPDGRLVLFEANATMIVLPPDVDPRWDYRRAAVRNVLEAVDALVRANGARCSQ